MGATAATTKKVSKWRPLFLVALRKTGNITAASRAAGIERSTAYRHRDKNEKFAADWDDALQEAVDSLETEAWRRARDGTKKPVIWKGEVTDYTLEYSDTLLIFLLKAHRPKMYRERLELSGDKDSPLFIKLDR